MASHRDADLRFERLTTLLGPSQGVQFLHIRQMLHAELDTNTVIRDLFVRLDLSFVLMQSDARAALADNIPILQESSHPSWCAIFHSRAGFVVNQQSSWLY